MLGVIGRLAAGRNTAETIVHRFNTYNDHTQICQAGVDTRDTSESRTRSKYGSLVSNVQGGSRGPKPNTR